MMLQKICLSAVLLAASTFATAAQMVSAISPDVIGPPPTELGKANGGALRRRLE